MGRILRIYKLEVKYNTMGSIKSIIPTIKNPTPIIFIMERITLLKFSSTSSQGVLLIFSLNEINLLLLIFFHAIFREISPTIRYIILEMISFNSMSLFEFYIVLRLCCRTITPYYFNDTTSTFSGSDQMPSDSLPSSRGFLSLISLLQFVFSVGRCRPADQSSG